MGCCSTIHAWSSSSTGSMLCWFSHYSSLGIDDCALKPSAWLLLPICLLLTGLKRWALYPPHVTPPGLKHVQQHQQSWAPGANCDATAGRLKNHDGSSSSSSSWCTVSETENEDGASSWTSSMSSSSDGDDNSAGSGLTSLQVCIKENTGPVFIIYNSIHMQFQQQNGVTAGMQCIGTCCCLWTCSAAILRMWAYLAGVPHMHLACAIPSVKP